MKHTFELTEDEIKTAILAYLGNEYPVSRDTYVFILNTDSKSFNVTAKVEEKR